MTITRAFPIAVHRWLEDGAGWTYDTSLESRVIEIGRQLKPQLEDRTTGDFEIPVDGERYIGFRKVDDLCLDPLATSRRPFIVAVAICPQSISKKTQEVVRKSLKSARLPPHHGPQEGLRCDLPDDSQDKTSWLSRLSQSLWAPASVLRQQAVAKLEAQFCHAVDRGDVTLLKTIVSDVFAAASFRDAPLTLSDLKSVHQLKPHCFAASVSTVDLAEDHQLVQVLGLALSSGLPVLHTYHCTNLKRRQFQLISSVIYEQ